MDTICRLAGGGRLFNCKVMMNFVQDRGIKRKLSHRLTHKPDFTEYEKLPGDQYQTVYVGYYDDKRHTDPRAQERFYRLNWGGWIRARGGRYRSQWRKQGPIQWWARQHVLCSERQTKILEQMFEQKYRKKTYFVDDPYEIYEDRDYEFLPYGTKPHNYSYIKAKKNQ